jgi:hypothetical protein
MDVLFVLVCPPFYLEQIRIVHSGHTIEVACCCEQLEYPNDVIIISNLVWEIVSFFLRFASSWEALGCAFQFRQSPTQEGSIQKNCEDIPALLLDKIIYDQNHSTSTVVSQMNPVNSYNFFLKVHFNIVKSFNRSA